MSPVGRSEDAIREARIGLSYDPLQPQTNNTVGQALRLAGRPQESLRYYRRAIELEPDVPDFHLFLGLAYMDLDRYPQALAEIDTAITLRGGVEGPTWPGFRAFIYAQTGRTGEARGLAARLEQAAVEGTGAWIAAAYARLGLGDLDKTFEALNRAIETRGFPSGPSFDPKLRRALEADPRWDLLLRKARLRV
jgi:tetratricopeptide (TPR) repeat protein